MTPQYLFDSLCALTSPCPGQMRLGALDEPRAILRRDWDMRVLDAASTDKRAFRTRPTGADPGDQFEPFITTEVLWSEDTGLWFSRGTWEGQTADAARHDGALAVFPTLDRGAKDWPGECP